MLAFLRPVLPVRGNRPLLYESPITKGVRQLNTERRIGVIGIVVEDREQAPVINNILSKYAEVIVGRMGIPYRERGLFVISIIVDGNTDEIGALTGKLGQVGGVRVKSALVTR